MFSQLTNRYDLYLLFRNYSDTEKHCVLQLRTDVDWNASEDNYLFRDTQVVGRRHKAVPKSVHPDKGYAHCVGPFRILGDCTGGGELYGGIRLGPFHIPIRSSWSSFFALRLPIGTFAGVVPS